MKQKHFTLFILCSFLPVTVIADARVDGFFPENLVTGNYFPEENAAESSVSSQSKDTFFITREERRRNPSKAPSNNITTSPNVFRVRTNSYDVRNPWNPTWFPRN